MQTITILRGVPTIASNHQAQIPFHNLLRQAKHAEIFPTLHYSFNLIEQFCDDDFIVPFDKHRDIVIKNKAEIIEGYQDPMNRLCYFPLHNPSQGRKKSNMISYSTSKNWCQHIKPMAPR